MSRLRARVLVLLAGAVVGGAVGINAAPWPRATGAALGVVVALLALVAEALGSRARIERLVWGLAGGLAGLVVGWLLALAAEAAVPAAGRALTVLFPTLGGGAGAMLGVRRGDDLTGLNALLFPRRAPERSLKLLDTSAIIDGRIADLAATGFVDGPLVIPAFVLRELQHIADSTEPRKRARGKRGFDVVQRLQRLPGGLTDVRDLDLPGLTDVDRKLVELAKTHGAKVVTTDYNLNKLAEVSGVTVLNVNELANALKPAAVAGETLTVHVLREGKEAGQGVAYLDDGTMVVVDQGKRWIGQSVDVAVTSVLQTPSGRIIFTRVRDEEPARA
ncbi:MAG TPA: PIN domain-containing protein [Terriglobales bacterium]|nr:PIN domain-containing protein [Terriglobales bacterium]